MQDLPSMQFLSAEDSAKVDAALLTSQDKFLARLAIYALRSLCQIAIDADKPISDIDSVQIADWIYRDAAIRQTIEVDTSFSTFFTNLVIAARGKLEAAAQDCNNQLENLTIEQLIAWFEKQGKRS